MYAYNFSEYFIPESNSWFKINLHRIENSLTNVQEFSEYIETSISFCLVEPLPVCYNVQEV